MKILFVSVEVSPFAKVGGLADVASALPKALMAMGHDVRIAMPAYAMIERDARWHKNRVASDVPVQMNPEWSKEAFVDQTDFDGVPVYLIGTDEWFDQSTRSDLVYLPGVEKYLFLAEAIPAVSKALNWKPDVVHCNDWHTGFLPVVLREKHADEWEDVATVFTIHNFAYQGEFGTEILDLLDLPQSLFHPWFVEAWGRVNFLKSGCVFADKVNTVSRSYANEIQTAQYGCGLDGLMRHLKGEGKLSGILNGIDRDVFNPETDPLIPAHFSASSPKAKAECRAALLQRLELPNDPTVPIVGVVSRLSQQKGLDLLVEAAERLVELPMTIIVQGLGDPWLAGKLRDLEAAHPTRLRFIEEFDESIAQLVYSGSDMFAMPSRFEPCGLGQMIALRYGTVPVVRRTGGLADTIFEGQNGFVFDNESTEELVFALARAAEAFRNPDLWADYVHAALTEDFGWEASAIRYVELYGQAIEARRAASRDEVLKEESA